MPFLDRPKNKYFQDFFYSELKTDENININNYTSDRLYGNRVTGIFLKRYVQGFLNITHQTILQIRDRYNFSKSSSTNPRKHY